MSTQEEKDLAALEAWAASDAPLTESGRVLTGDEARHAGQELAAKVRRGKPNLGEKSALGRGRSPRVQVRLSPETVRRVEELAEATGTKVSVVMRVAVDELLRSPDAKTRILEDA